MIAGLFAAFARAFASRRSRHSATIRPTSATYASYLLESRRSSVYTCRSGIVPAAPMASGLSTGVSVSASSSSSSLGGFSFVSPKWPLMPLRSNSQNAARGYSHDSTTMSPFTDSRKSRPVWSGPRSYRLGTTDTSRSGSSRSAATTLSSSARLAGCLPGACDRTTVTRVRLIRTPAAVAEAAGAGPPRAGAVGVS